MRFPKLMRGDLVELRYGPYPVLREVQSYTKGGRRRDYPIKRESLKDMGFTEGIYYYRAKDELWRILAVWRRTSDDKMERIWKK